MLPNISLFRESFPAFLPSQPFGRYPRCGGAIELRSIIPDRGLSPRRHQTLRQSRPVSPGEGLEEVVEEVVRNLAKTRIGLRPHIHLLCFTGRRGSHGLVPQTKRGTNQLFGLINIADVLVILIFM